MMTTKPALTIAGAVAALREMGLALNPASLRRYCWQGQLEAGKRPTPRGEEWVVEEGALQRFASTRRKRGRPPRQQQPPAAAPHGCH